MQRHRMPQEDRIRKEAASKAINNGNRMLAEALGIPVPLGPSPSEIRAQLIEEVRERCVDP